MPLTFSVVIPAYNQAEFLGEAIDSVLAQTYPHFELIVVNDASPDDTEEVVRQYTDPRVKYIRHAQNKGLPATRNTGMRAGTGDCIALLDSDDYFHPEKLAVHAAFLEQHPEVGVTYNPRFELYYFAPGIHNLYRPPVRVSLYDLVIGFPFAPSDMVIRSEWVNKAGVFDETLVNGAEDLDYPCRLALHGCIFASVDIALNYRRYNPKKIHKNLKKRRDEYYHVLDRIMNDSRCPTEVKAIRNQAFAEQTLYIMFLAFNQGETEFGRETLNDAIVFDSNLTDGNLSKLVNYLTICSINHGEPDHANILKKIFRQFPLNLCVTDDQYDKAVSHGWIIKCFYSTIWNGYVPGKECFNPKLISDVKIDPYFINFLVGNMCDIDAVISQEASQAAMEKLASLRRWLLRNSLWRYLESRLFINRAFRHFYDGEFSQVKGCIFKAIIREPKLLFNRGVVSMFVHSVL